MLLNKSIRKNYEKEILKTHLSTKQKSTSIIYKFKI